jgi:hypothetical protein
MAFFSSGISGLDRETVAMIYDLFLLAGKIGCEACGVNPITGVETSGSYDVGAARGSHDTRRGRRRRPDEPWPPT